ncbi:hypothetical protein DPMN_026626 [Dreissena polymorpha]|uniref:Death domain-containing protein n=1 Tax=Dreissena polymorpha TaxID=45954 RepID=A0A9D4RDP4_DREPO|nr:hypothetical protein DPMN_026626 [Dreissena polymorpha]
MALKQKTFELAASSNVTIDTHKPCIALLLQWDRTDGYGKSFRDLTLRLGQIGRHDVASKLEKVVYGKEADDLEKKFLRNPFKKNIPKDSVILDQETKSERPTINSTDIRHTLSGFEIFSISTGSLTAFVIVFYILYRFFGTAIKTTFEKFAPEFLVQWVDLVRRELRFLCRRTKRKFSRDVIGARGVVSDRASVMNLNRNLNNYLHGNLPDTVLYFNNLLK